MNVAYLLIGGNIGDRLENLKSAASAIEKNCGPILRRSSVYETEAWGKTDQDAFLNQALQINTMLPPEDLLHCLLSIEKTMGREREMKYGPRVIDIDILLFNNLVLHSSKLTIPHPELINRRFALQCLDDIAAGEMHPTEKKTIRHLLLICPDNLKVDKFHH